ncbi:SH3 domain-containing protein [Cavenderia fasciculata]|uniref:SH3 domain-containing protein n=1 Tax=Cavenderia fasciculata TaxID=261658 RepID=F4PY03_CACFS|nr:SH3 domain-containing protein [Cavenderia fasciculata]EGG19663.1 SH3 domain-containing protein [Cavenderia fasciculata]|eukprot:XP_004357957.1 SH3 domain-containing protein [Cavenderia fasciculata]
MNICDMNSAATYLRQQGTFYQKINESELVFEEYFRVGYYGKRFPASIQNREFIYKGNEFERLSDFITKTLDKWPKAELLKSTETPSKEVMESDGMHVLITSVNVSSMAEAQKRQSLNLNGSDGAFAGGKKRVPQRVQQFNARTKVNVFLYSKPFKKQANRSSTNEFEDLWLNNHYLVCETPFPCTERRSLVVDRISVEVSPIENALNSIVQKNEELLARIDRYQQNQNENINPLTMTLNGIIDASVNGGVSRYELFLTEPYLSKHPENKHIADCLRVSMDQQIVVLEKALKLHGTLINSSMAAMQEKLESIFNTMKSEKTAKYMYNN